jgi:glycosyltransferase involved in cell wall biosynthesis
MTGTAPMRVLVLVQGSLGERRTGPEIRGLEMARAFGERHEVTIAAAVPSERAIDGFRVVPSRRRTLMRELRRHDAVVGPSLPPYTFLAGRECVRVADLYDPGELEMATIGGWRGRRHASQQRASRRLQLRWADVVLGANERQLELIERDLDEESRDSPPRLFTVPMGLPPAPPAAAGSPLRERFDAIGPGDPVVLWWGNAWRWLDAEGAVEAIAILAERRSDIRLVITAGRPPNASTDPLNVTEEVRAVASARGLLGRHVFFLDEWVPYEDRHHYLADADLGISLHADTPEAALAARARYMDCVWASLPLVLAEGDEVAARLGRAGAAVLVPPRDPGSAAAAIDGLLADRRRIEAAREACRAISAEYAWPALLEPMVECVERIRKSPLPPGDWARAARQSTGYYARRAVDRGLMLD